MLGFHAAGGYYFSEIIHAELVVRDDPPGPAQIGSLTALAGGAVVITRDQDPDVADDLADAVVGIRVEGSLIVAGPATATQGSETTRPVLDTVGPLPEATGQAVALERAVWSSPAEAGLDYSEVTILSGGSPYPAWMIPAPGSDTWAVLAHGKQGLPCEMLRMARALRRAGVSSLVVTYTGDPGVPPPPNGMWGFGTTEVPEIEAAVRFAQQAGARRVILGGESHGASVMLGFLTSSPLAGEVDGAILDSPPADLAATIDALGDLRSLPFVGLPIPESLERAATWIAERRYDIDFADYDYTARADELTVPLLVLMGGRDQTVAPRVVRDFVAAVGPEASLLEFPAAHHVSSWNADPPRYEAAVADFVAGL